MKMHIGNFPVTATVLSRSIVPQSRLYFEAINCRCFVLSFCFCLTSFFTCVAQGEPLDLRVDTIYATTSKTTSLIFPSRISIYDIGSEEFGGVKEDNLLLLKAAHESAMPTSLIIKFGETVYHGTLAYSNNPPHLFIDFSKFSAPADPKPPKEGEMSKVDSLRSLDENTYEKRLNLMLSDPKSYYKDNAVKDTKEKIALTLTDLRTDENNVYIKMLFINQSKLDYQIDFAEFVYQNPVEDRELKGALDRKNVYLNASSRIDFVKAKDERHLAYSIPRFTLGKKGELVVIVREKNGSRSISLALPFNLILEAKTIIK